MSEFTVMSICQTLETYCLTHYVWVTPSFIPHGIKKDLPWGHKRIQEQVLVVNINHRSFHPQLLPTVCVVFSSIVAKIQTHLWQISDDFIHASLSAMLPTSQQFVSRETKTLDINSNVISNSYIFNQDLCRANQITTLFFSALNVQYSVVHSLL